MPIAALLNVQPKHCISYISKSHYKRRINQSRLTKQRQRWRCTMAGRGTLYEAALRSRLAPQPRHINASRHHGRHYRWSCFDLSNIAALRCWRRAALTVAKNRSEKQPTRTWKSAWGRQPTQSLQILVRSCKATALADLYLLIPVIAPCSHPVICASYTSYRSLSTHRLHPGPPGSPVTVMHNHPPTCRNGSTAPPRICRSHRRGASRTNSPQRMR